MQQGKNRAVSQNPSNRVWYEGESTVLAKIKSNIFKIINNSKNIFKSKIKSPCSEIFFSYASSSSVEPSLLPGFTQLWTVCSRKNTAYIFIGRLSKLTEGIYWKVQRGIFYYCLGNICIFPRLWSSFEKNTLFSRRRETIRLLKLKLEFLSW